MLCRLEYLRDTVNKSSIPMLELEEHWTQLVTGAGDLGRRAWEQQEAIWEIITTEQRYIQVMLFARLELAFAVAQADGRALLLLQRASARRLHEGSEWRACLSQL